MVELGVVYECGSSLRWLTVIERLMVVGFGDDPNLVPEAASLGCVSSLGLRSSDSERFWLSILMLETQGI